MKKFLINVLNNTAMESAKMFELALGIAVIGMIFIGGFLFARQSDRATVPRGNTK
jgi:hypothetical protein